MMGAMVAAVMGGALTCGGDSEPDCGSGICGGNNCSGSSKTYQTCIASNGTCVSFTFKSADGATKAVCVCGPNCDQKAFMDCSDQGEVKACM